MDLPHGLLGQERSDGTAELSDVACLHPWVAAALTHFCANREQGCSVLLSGWIGISPLGVPRWFDEVRDAQEVYSRSLI